jgi:hypothetical protein
MWQMWKNIMLQGDILLVLSAFKRWVTENLNNFKLELKDFIERQPLQRIQKLMYYL